MLLQLWDTAGMERFCAVPKSYYVNSHIFICMFDLSCKKSFNSVMEEWIPTAYSFNNITFPILIVVGNKNDLERVVSREEVEVW